jgi:hypothetical protein
MLLAAVFIRHGAVYWIADMTGFSPAAMHYILGGLWEIVLSSTIIMLMAGYPNSLWRNLAIGASAIAILEGAQIAGCRLAIGRSLEEVPKGMNLCDYLAGIPVGPYLLAVYLFIVVYAIGCTFRKR